MSSNNPLYSAINADEVKKLLLAGFNPNDNGGAEHSILVMHVENTEDELTCLHIVAALVEGGASLEEETIDADDESRAVVVAANNGKYKLLKFFVEMGADTAINAYSRRARSFVKQNVLFPTGSDYNLNKLKILVESSTCLINTKVEGQTPLHTFTERAGSSTSFKLADFLKQNQDSDEYVTSNESGDDDEEDENEEEDYNRSKQIAVKAEMSSTDSRTLKYRVARALAAAKDFAFIGEVDSDDEGNDDDVNSEEYDSDDDCSRGSKLTEKYTWPVELIVTHGADITIKNRHGQMPLDCWMSCAYLYNWKSYQNTAKLLGGTDEQLKAFEIIRARHNNVRLVKREKKKAYLAAEKLRVAELKLNIELLTVALQSYNLQEVQRLVQLIPRFDSLAIYEASIISGVSMEVRESYMVDDPYERVAKVRFQDLITDHPADSRRICDIIDILVSRGLDVNYVPFQDSSRSAPRSRFQNLCNRINNIQEEDDQQDEGMEIFPLISMYRAYLKADDPKCEQTWLDVMQFLVREHKADYYIRRPLRPTEKTMRAGPKLCTKSLIFYAVRALDKAIVTDILTYHPRHAEVAVQCYTQEANNVLHELLFGLQDAHRICRGDATLFAQHIEDAVAIADMLIEAGADCKRVNSKDFTPSELAKYIGGAQADLLVPNLLEGKMGVKKRKSEAAKKEKLLKAKPSNKKASTNLASASSDLPPAEATIEVAATQQSGSSNSSSAAADPAPISLLQEQLKLQQEMVKNAHTKALLDEEAYRKAVSALEAHQLLASKLQDERDFLKKQFKMSNQIDSACTEQLNLLLKQELQLEKKSEEPANKKRKAPSASAAADDAAEKEDDDDDDMSVTSNGKSSGGMHSAKKSKTDPKEPKKAVSAYMFYCQQAKAGLTKGMPLSQQKALLRVQWTALTVLEKLPYEQAAANDKNRYILDVSGLPAIAEM